MLSNLHRLLNEYRNKRTKTTGTSLENVKPLTKASPKTIQNNSLIHLNLHANAEQDICFGSNATDEATP